MHELVVRDLHVAYAQVEAVRGINLHVNGGQIVALIGPNGAGKSTLLNAIGGILPSNGSTRGTIRLFDQDMAGVAVETRVRHGMCLVPEKRELFSSMAVQDNLLLGGYRRYSAGERAYADQLEMVYQLFPRLYQRRKQQAASLSGGEQQMLALGRALMAKPKLLMLDEPSLGLGVLIVKEMFQIIAQLKQMGMAILLVEQNARAALQIADYAYVLELGKIVLHGTQLAHDQRVIDTYLGWLRKPE